MNLPLHTDLPHDGGMNRWDQPIEYYETALMPFVQVREVAKIIGKMVLDIQPHSSLIGWCFDGATVYGLEKGTEIIFSYGEYCGYTAVITNFHVDKSMHMVNFNVITEADEPIIIRDVGYFDLWEIYGAMVKLECESNAIRLDHEQFDHCFGVRHVI